MSESTVNRRQFARGVAAGLGGATLTSAAVADEKPESEPLESPKLSELDARLLQVIPHYDDARLTDEVLAEIRRDIRSHMSRGRELSRFPLTNADEPVFVFAAHRND